MNENVKVLLESYADLCNIEVMNEAEAEQAKKAAVSKIKLIKGEKVFNDFIKGKMDKATGKKTYKKLIKELNEASKLINDIPKETTIEKIKWVAKQIFKSGLIIAAITSAYCLGSSALVSKAYGIPFKTVIGSKDYNSLSLGVSIATIFNTISIINSYKVNFNKSDACIKMRKVRNNVENAYVKYYKDKDTDKE